MPHIDLTIPIAILFAAFVNVLLIRAYAAWGNRRIEERTDAWLAQVKGQAAEEPKSESESELESESESD